VNVGCGEDGDRPTLTLRLPELRKVDIEGRCSRTNLSGCRPQASRAAAAAAAAALASASDVDELLTGGDDTERHDRRSSVPLTTIGSTTAFAAEVLALEERSAPAPFSTVDVGPSGSAVDDVDDGVSDVGGLSGRRDPPRNVRNVLIRDVMLDVTSAVDTELLALAMMFCGSETSVARLRGDENGRGPGNTPKYDAEDDHNVALSSNDVEPLPRDRSSPPDDA